MTKIFMPISKMLMRNCWPEVSASIVNIDGTNVAESYWSHFKKIEAKRTIDSMRLAPPSEFSIVEVSRTPDLSSISLDGCKPMINGPYAVLTNFVPTERLGRTPEGLIAFGAFRSATLQPKSSAELLDIFKVRPDQPGWLMVSTVIGLDPIGEAMALHVIRYTFLNKDGSLHSLPVTEEMNSVLKSLPASSRNGVVGLYEHLNPVKDDYTDAGQIKFQLSFGAYFASSDFVLGFLGCKNVSTREAVERISGNRARKGHKPHRYHILQISSPTGQTASGCDAGPKDLTPLHLRRGHIKLYTPEKPLLGKHVGPIYFSQTTVGKMRNGIVQKDYQAETGENHEL